MTRAVKRLSIGQQIGIYLLGFAMFGNAAISPAMQRLQEAFPDTPFWIVTMLQTLPNLFIIFGALLAGFIIAKGIRFKTIGIFAMLVYGIFNVIITWFHPNLEVVLVMRALAGFGNGLLFPLGAATILRFIQNKNARGSYLSRNQAVGSGGAIILTLAGGWFANISWEYTFLAFILVFIALIIVFFTYPEPPTVEEIIADNPEAAEEVGGNAKSVKLPLLCWFFLLMIMFYQILQSPALMQLAPLMVSVGADAGVVGTLMSLFTIANTLLAALTGVALRTMKRFASLPFWIGGAIGILLIAFGTNIVMFAVGVFLLGVAIGPMVLTPYEISLLTTPAGMAWAASLSMVFANLGSFLSSYWLGFLSGVIGADAQGGLIICAVGFVLCGVLWCVVNLFNKAWRKG
jgi:MFS family permease